MSQPRCFVRGVCTLYLQSVRAVVKFALDILASNRSEAELAGQQANQVVFLTFHALSRNWLQIIVTEQMLNAMNRIAQ